MKGGSFGTPLRAARHALIRAAIAEYRKARTAIWRQFFEVSQAKELERAAAIVDSAQFARDARDHRSTAAAWTGTAARGLTRAAALREQARTMGEAMRVLRTIADNPIRPEPCLPPQCVWCEHQQPRFNGAHEPDCALARLLR